LHEQWKEPVDLQGGGQEIVDRYTITMMGHDRREYEFWEVGIDRADNLNFTKVVIEDEDFVPVIWSTVSETQ
ncbi:MAG: hypothetical protein ACPF9D_01170, partial [Owenweeksia sp.]